MRQVSTPTIPSFFQGKDGRNPFSPSLSCRAPIFVLPSVSEASPDLLSCRASARHPRINCPAERQRGIHGSTVLPSNPFLSCRALARHPRINCPAEQLLFVLPSVSEASPTNSRRSLGCLRTLGMT